MPKSISKNKRVKKTIESTEGKYDVCVSIGDFVVQAKTDSVSEMILGIKPVKVMNKVVFSVRGDGKATELFLYPVRAKRVFYNRMAADYFAKRLLLSMK